MNNNPIGFFDSGIGGLTSVTHIMKMLPNEDIIYFGDTARSPYGSKSPETIRKFSAQVADFLISKNAKMIVIACNTATAISLDYLRKLHPNMPIIGCILPTAIEVVKQSSEKDVIGIVATKATVESNVYRETIVQLSPNLHVEQVACPALVPLIEEGLVNSNIMDLTLKYYLDDFIYSNGITKLVLGCTHYPLVSKNIAKLYPQIGQLSSSKALAEAVKKELQCNGLNASRKKAVHDFYASDDSGEFESMIRMLGNRHYNIRIMNLEK